MPQLNVFISHKMPSDQPIAVALETELRILSRGAIKVFQAGQMRQGEEYQKKLRRALDETDWLVFLHTNDDEDWGFCMFECGYFRRVMQSDQKNKLLITFCRSQTQVNAALQDFNVAPISEQELTEFLKQACRQEPWYSNPDVEDAEIKESATRIMKAFAAAGTKTTRHVHSSFCIELELPETETKTIATVPGDAIVSGIPGWESIFGKPISGQRWTWTNLLAGIGHRRHYDFLLSRAMTRALKSDTPRPFLLRVKNKTYRLSLHKYDEVAPRKLTFHIVAVPVDHSDDENNLLYNLVDLSWNFRKTIVEDLYTRVLELQSTDDPDIDELNGCYADLEEKLIEISTESISRGIDNPRVLQTALQKVPESVNLIRALKDWKTFQKDLFESIQKGKAGIDVVATSLHKMATLNHEMYVISAKGYLEQASTLPPPPTP